MGKTVNELLNIARAEIGYKEKSSTRYDLDDKEAGAGSNNFTKYARDLYKAGYYQASKQGCEWCDMFVDWCFYQLCGNKKDAEAMICQTGVYGAACSASASCYKAVGRFFSTPKVGDQIFFGYNGKFQHTGLVEKVENNRVYTIEGNADNMVKRKNYKLTDSWIRGYGRPIYEGEQEEPTEPQEPVVPTEYVPTVKEWQKAAIADGFKFPRYGADGEWGAECESVAKKAIVKKRITYKYKNLTKIVQQVVGVKADGKCGSETSAAIKNYQRKHGLNADGAVGLNTWKRILNVK